jgi:hypothetical protein
LHESRASPANEGMTWAGSRQIATNQVIPLPDPTRRGLVNLTNDLITTCSRVVATAASLDPSQCVGRPGRFPAPSLSHGVRTVTCSWARCHRFRTAFSWAFSPGNDESAPIRIFMTIAARPPLQENGSGVVARRKLSPERVPHLRPQVASGRLCRCNMHVKHAMLAPSRMDAMPSQREGQGSTPLSSTLGCCSSILCTAA